MVDGGLLDGGFEVGLGFEDGRSMKGLASVGLAEDKEEDEDHEDDDEAAA